MNSYNFIGDDVIIENNIIKARKIASIYPEPANGYVGEFILDILKRSPNHVAQIEAETGRETTNAEMTEKIIRCALWLQKQNINTGDVVAHCSELHVNAYIPQFATFCAGALYNPFFTKIDTDRARHLIDVAKPKVMFCHENMFGTLQEAVKLEKMSVKFVTFERVNGECEFLDDILQSQSAEEVENFKAKFVDLQDNALLLFTTGTTGPSKGVLHNYKSIAYNMLRHPIYYLPENNITLFYSPTSYITGMMYSMANCVTNATRILHQRFDIEETSKVIEKYKVNWTYLDPLVVLHLSKLGVFASKKSRFDSLKVILSGGGVAISSVFVDTRKYLPHVKLRNVWGPTEVAALSIVQNDNCKVVNSLGFILPNLQAKVIDKSGNPLGPNQLGELCLKQSVLMQCYLKDTAATNKALDSEGWYHTGDKVFYKENGELMFVDRMTYGIHYKNHVLSPTELEDNLWSHPAVLEVAVLTLPDKDDGERPVAFIERVKGVEATEEDIIKHSYKFGEHKGLSGGVIFVDKMPRIVCKISKQECQLLLEKFIESKKKEEQRS